MGRRKRDDSTDPNTRAFLAAAETLSRHPMFRPLLGDPSANGLRRAECVWCDDDTLARDHGWARLMPGGLILVNRNARATEAEWLWILTHCLLHLGFGHTEPAGPADRAYR